MISNTNQIQSFINPINKGISNVSNKIDKTLGNEEIKTPETSFQNVLSNALSEVNDSQLAANAMSQKVVLDPSSVQPHEIAYTLSKAEMSIYFAKSVVNRVVDAYRELVNIR